MEKIIITLGPALINRHELPQIHNAQRYIYRINGAHGDINDIRAYVNQIRKVLPDAQLMIDLPGNKIRTKNIPEPIPFTAGTRIKLLKDNFNYPALFEIVEQGMQITTNDGLNHFEIDDIGDESMTVKALNEGYVYNNKGFYANGTSKKLPFLFEKDQQILALAKEMDISFLGISFVRNLDDIIQVFDILKDKGKMICKVETSDAMAHLPEIMDFCDMILIDRGDLSLEVGIENVPTCIDKILEYADHTKVFMATQFLTYMLDKPIPLLSEVCDLHNTMKKGIYGIQLSEETAIGQYPVECIRTIETLMEKI